MSATKLVFYPQQPQQPVDNEQLVRFLVDIEFCASEADANGHYLPGNRFLSLLTFLGCSPSINLTPTEGESHCYITLIDHHSQPVCLGHTSTAKPKCPHCKKRIGNWQKENWLQPDQPWICDKCHTESLFSELNWKHECGYARGGFEVAHIYPHEAVPTEQLLNALQEHTGFAWTYCYTHQGVD